MKAMKNLGMNRMLGSVRRKRSPANVPEGGPEAPPLDTPEANAERSVKLFCEAGGPTGQQGEEVLYLPTIVEAAESSPAAAKECAVQIRKFLAKEFARPHTQYNGIMLIRILSDNPGQSFTRNFDAKFVDAVKQLLRNGSDPKVRQILEETLGSFERDKAADNNLLPLLQMWKKEQERTAKSGAPKVGVLFGASYNAHLGLTSPQVPQGSSRSRQPATSQPFDNQNYFSRSHAPSGRLPAPEELASRIEEARTSAKLLTQLVQSTPPEEFLHNDLVREFANRCQSASRSIQGYMTSENPSPDNDTMLTMIETTELLSLAMTKHQRAVLNTRKQLGLGSEPFTSPGGTSYNAATPPTGQPVQPFQPAAPAPPPNRTDSDFAPPPPGPPPNRKIPAVPVPTRPHAEDSRSAGEGLDPFRDPAVTKTHNPPFPGLPKQRQAPVTEERLDAEPYHPEFHPTQSYMGRQTSAVGQSTMHGGVPQTPQEEPDDDLYDMTPKKDKKPSFRY